MPLRAPKMYGFIFGFQRLVWWPKWTPASSSCFMLMAVPLEVRAAAMVGSAAAVGAASAGTTASAGVASTAGGCVVSSMVVLRLVSTTPRSCRARRARDHVSGTGAHCRERVRSLTAGAFDGLAPPLVTGRVGTGDLARRAGHRKLPCRLT